MIQLAELLAGVGVACLIGLVGLLVLLLLIYGPLWLQAYFSGIDVSVLTLICIRLRRVSPIKIVVAKVMLTQADVAIADRDLSLARLEAHVLAGGDLMRVMQAVIAAHRAGIELRFERAAAIDLAGRDVLEAVQTSVSPKVIDCPNAVRSDSNITAIAKDGVELLIRARVTVRTNLSQLIGGATEETIIARIGEGIISTVGSADSHMDVMAQPDRISLQVLSGGLDSNTAFEIISIDIVDISIGNNIGARLQSNQAAADMRVAQAAAETRKARAIAKLQEMKAEVAHKSANVLSAKAEVPAAMAHALRQGNVRVEGKTWDFSVARLGPFEADQQATSAN